MGEYFNGLERKSRKKITKLSILALSINTDEPASNFLPLNIQQRRTQEEFAIMATLLPKQFFAQMDYFVSHAPSQVIPKKDRKDWWKYNKSVGDDFMDTLKKLRVQATGEVRGMAHGIASLLDAQEKKEKLNEEEIEPLFKKTLKPTGKKKFPLLFDVASEDSKSGHARRLKPTHYNGRIRLGNDIER